MEKGLSSCKAYWPLAIFLIVAWPSRCPAATTYYVRTDGGTATQCNGTSNAPYPGSGTNQACAWSHPFWALDASGNWKIQGGDTLIINPGSYRMGFGSHRMIFRGVNGQ